MTKDDLSYLLYSSFPTKGEGTWRSGEDQNGGYTMLSMATSRQKKFYKMRVIFGESIWPRSSRILKNIRVILKDYYFLLDTIAVGFFLQDYKGHCLQCTLRPMAA